MPLGEPPRTQYDLQFQFFGIPVRIHPFFWLVALLLGPWEPIHGESVVVLMAMWILALFVSILLHEMGHATAMRVFGYRPWITLYGLGGLASYGEPGTYGGRGHTGRAQILISLAGPGAGFLFAAVITGAIVLSGHGVRVLVGFPFGISIEPAEIIGSLRLTWLILQLLFINVLWGLVNLLPVYPLDGGQVAREVFLKISPRNGIRLSLVLSIVTAAALAVMALTQGENFYVALMFGYLAYSSYVTLQAYGNQRSW